MRKEPKQARSKQTRRKLISTLSDLLREKEFDQITVIEIAKAAGVSSGLLYSHFSNKADFLEALLDEYKARIVERLVEVEVEGVEDEFREQGGLRKALQLITRYAFEQMLEDAHIIRAISHFLKSRPESEELEWKNLRARAFRTIVPVLDIYEAELARSNNEQTAEMLVYFFNTAFLEAILLPKSGTGTIDMIGEEAFILDIADFAYGYLTTPQT